MQTFPLIGNYGIITEDFESKCHVRAYVVREKCDTPSNFRSEYDLDTFLKNNGVPGIWGIDTREVTKILRENGAMNACVCGTLPDNFDFISGYKITDAVPSVTCRNKYTVECEAAKYDVALLDCGAKKSLIRALTDRCCRVHVFPADSSAEEILAQNPEGIVISEGPGDPADNPFIISQISKIISSSPEIPVFGIGLGHQLLALAKGAKTYKLSHGHRGTNQPAKDVSGGRTYITTQNHGFAVDTESISNGNVSFINPNDRTCEGIDYTDISAFSVQFLPAGETSFLFDRFISMMGGKN